MIISDSLYGGFELPDWCERIILTPEVQRLRGIRLINTSSPTLTSLSDVRRYTHSIGVLKLAIDFSEKNGLSQSDAKLIGTAAICHDLGTPPFGHLFEYLLKATQGWSHENMVSSILDGTYRPEGRFSQILRGRELTLGKRLRNLGVDTGTVGTIAAGGGEFGQLVAGSLDFDNIDNIARMAQMLGIRGFSGAEAESLVSEFSIHSGSVAISHQATLGIQNWTEVRRSVYRLLALDETNLAGQSMLTDCLTEALALGEVDANDWFWTDEWLLYRLEQISQVKATIQRFNSGDLFETIFLGWYDVPQGPVDYRHPTHRETLRGALEEVTRIPCSPYVFYDRGTFSNKLQLRYSDGTDVNCTVSSETSQSTIIGVFSPRREVSPKLFPRIRDVLEHFGYSSSAIRPLPNQRDVYGLPGQKKFAI